jgi:hypothetical protein
MNMEDSVFAHLLRGKSTVERSLNASADTYRPGALTSIFAIWSLYIHDVNISLTLVSSMRTAHLRRHVSCLNIRLVNCNNKPTGYPDIRL